MKHIALSVLLSVAAVGANAQSLPVYLDSNRPVEERIDDALNRMTLQEKIRIIHAQSKFSSAGVPRLGFPDFWTDDGPHGVRPDVLWDEWEQAGQTNDSCVAFPALTCLAARCHDAFHFFGNFLFDGRSCGLSVYQLHIPGGFRGYEDVAEVISFWVMRL